MTTPTTNHHRYRIGIDVGTHSVGFAAIGLNNHGTPDTILNAMSLIHDNGVDPNHNKRALTRKNTSGIARRTQRRIKRAAKLRAKLDHFLDEHNYPLINLEKESAYLAPWHARATLVTSYITDDDTRRAALALAFRHIIRHRGWRNPYVSTDALINADHRTPSQGFINIQQKFAPHCSQSITESMTLAECVVALDNPKTTLRGDNGLFAETIHQGDLVREIRAIADTQRLDDAFTNDLMRIIFDMKSPRGSAAQYVGKDELDPSQRRAWKALSAFQHYRIISVLANVRITDADTDEIRPLSIDERQTCFDFLSTYTKPKKPTWTTIADLLGCDRGELHGTAMTSDDGEPVSANPPINDTHRIFATCKIKPLKKQWLAADADTREAIIRQFSHVDINHDLNDQHTAYAAQIIESLSADDVALLDSINLPQGRCPYSEKTLTKLTNNMLSTSHDVHAARIAVFNVPDDWKPAPPPIHEQTTNPAVNKVLKAVNRWIDKAEKRWGTPEAINIECLRGGFSSERITRELTDAMKKRAKQNAHDREAFNAQHNRHGHVKRSEIIRHQALQRQHHECAYCGVPITYDTMELDHIVPRSGVGSTNIRNNLLACCKQCNNDKSDRPFASWADSTTLPNISLDMTIKRVKNFAKDDGLSTKQWNQFTGDIIARLRRTTRDDELDARSTESVSWMAVELARRIEGRYDNDKPKINIFRGEITAGARKLSGIENTITLHGGKTGKNRLDRRHHALDAIVIAMMQPKVAQVIIERNSLRTEQHYTGKINPIYGHWRDYTGRTVGDQYVFKLWIKNMRVLLPMIQNALDNDQIPVTSNIRAKFGNSLVHKEGIKPLHRVKLKEALPVSLIDRAAIPGLWVALTRHPDYDPKKGLPADNTRTISVNGRYVHADDDIEFFPTPSPAVKVRHGYAELGSAIHHARLFKITEKNKTTYAMMRVYTVDLRKHQREDLFSVELPPQAISVRCATPKLRKALAEGRAEYVTWFVVGDEIHCHADTIAQGKNTQFFTEFPNTTRWRVCGMPGNDKLRLRPTQLASEGLDDESSAEAQEIIYRPGWLVAISKVFGPAEGTIVCRNAHGQSYKRKM